MVHPILNAGQEYNRSLRVPSTAISTGRGCTYSEIHSEVMLMGFYTVIEVAAKLKVSIGLVYKIISSEKLGCHRFGSAVRIGDDQLASYIEASSQDDRPIRKTRTGLRRLR